LDCSQKFESPEMPETVSFTASARLTRLTITSVCTDGETHRFQIDLDGNIANVFHDADTDAVMRALGAEPHGCGVALLTYEAAKAAFDAYAGLADNPAARHNGRRWKTEQTCQSCGRYPTLTHLNSTTHYLGVQGLTSFTRQANIIFRWLKRNNLEVSEPYQNFTEVESDCRRFGPSTRHGRYYQVPNSGNYIGGIRSSTMTRSFVEAARVVLGNDAHALAALRSRGVTVQWISRLAQTITSRAAHNFREANPLESMLTIIGGARNVAPEKVAAFLNAGIYAHIYTYVKAHATPEQVKYVWNATQGRKNLAALMNETGKTAAEIVTQMRREMDAAR
jgi:hypothetical protein